MKFILKILLIFFLSWAAQLYLPFWSVAIVAFAVCFLLSERILKNRFSRRKNARPSKGFLAGFLAVFLLWGGKAALTDWKNASVLSGKMAQLFLSNLPLPESADIGPLAMIVLTGLIGGLLGGLGAMSGNLFGQLVKS